MSHRDSPSSDSLAALAALLFALVALPVSGGEPATALSNPVAGLAWLAGTWTGTKDGVASEETWTSPEGGGLVGLHKDVAGGRMVSFEFFRIGPVDGGGIAYFASPQGAPATPFRLVELADRRVVFENASHDFPQRILYWLDAQGRLHARIEGSLAGQPAAEEWRWDRR
ncbi:MAG: DUF6265 family protein [Thermoanaerobaculia bacterium]